MPALLTIITEDDLLDFASDKVDAETRGLVKAAAETDDRVKRLLASCEHVERVLDDLSGAPKAPR